MSLSDTVEAMESWSLPQWLHVLENRYANEIQLGLERIQKVAQQLDLLSPDAHVITVAGTNGKGSTVAALQSVYTHAGYRVGAYTSPHLVRFNERITINGAQISDAELVSYFTTIEKARQQTPLTYFETVTLAALLHFKLQKTEIILLEVGLGGRLDATNIIDADFAIITTIDFDHQDFLGNTLEAIGAEKAGILRPQHPLVYADSFMPASIQNRATALNCPVYQLSRQYHCRMQEGCFYYESDTQTLKLLDITIHPQAAGAAITAIELGQSKVPVAKDAIFHGLQQAFVPARLQRLHHDDRDILIDVSHNPQSVALLADYLQTNHEGRKIHAVFAGLRDKPVGNMIAALKSKVAFWYPAQLHVNRAMSAENLLKNFAEHGIYPKTCHNDSFAAFKAAHENSSKEDLILVYGSFITAGEVLGALNNKE